MENRWITRKPLDRRVNLRLPDGSTRTGVVHNISLGGMFVSFADVPALDTMVDLSFELDDAEDGQFHRIPSQVVHVTPRGAGIMFCDFNPRTVRRMRETLYGRHDAA
ncbi:MAG TPA: PilZ domain-containing protein [Acidiferrobacterales bacterium]|jgi:c-di-GMP-binding flagellar brake protein YcgR